MDAYEDFLNDVKDIEDFSTDEREKFKKKVDRKIFSDLDKVQCEHRETIIVNSSEVCSECGIVIKDDTSCEKDWKYYGSSDNKYSKDLNRCHKRKSDQRTIYKDVETMDFPESIIRSANKRYQVIIKNNIYRGAKRKAIIVACIYYAYMEQGEHRTSDEISQKFNIKKKSVKEGFARYCETFPEASTLYIDAKNLIRQIMIRTNINFSHLRKINRLCDYSEDRSPLLNRSNPQSVAAAIVYIYLCLEPEYKEKIGMSKIKFANIMNLSDITITKLGKELQRIIQNEEVRL